MKNNFLVLLLFSLFLLPCLSFFVTSQDMGFQVADYIFCDGNIITIDDTNPICEAIAIRDGTIVGLGTTEEVLADFITETNTTYDLQGKTLMPGFIDGHTHYIHSASLLNGQELYDHQELPLSYGFTTLNEKTATEDWIHFLQQAETDGYMRLRVNCFPKYNLPTLDQNNETIVVQEWLGNYDSIMDHDKKVRVPGIKVFVDGYSGDRGALSVVKGGNLATGGQR